MLNTAHHRIPKPLSLFVLFAALSLVLLVMLGRNEQRVSAQEPAAGKIAFSSIRDGNPEIYVMNADGSHRRG